MSSVIFSLLTGIKGEIKNFETVNTSFPGFIPVIKSLGAKIIEHGQGFDDARQFAEKLSVEEGYYYIHSANEPRLVEGTGTYTLEILEDQPDIDVIIVPIGGGSGACGACIVSNAVNSNIKVIGVQSHDSPGAYFSWKDGKITE